MNPCRLCTPGMPCWPDDGELCQKSPNNLAAGVDRYMAERIRAQCQHIGRCSSRVQAEIIAHHYTAHAAEARDLAEVLKYTQHAREKDQKSAHELSAELVRILKTAHAYELGILLEWPRL